jgi:hypothetical protein
MKRHQGMNKYNLAFRRRGLNTEFVGDTRLFSCKYPSDPYDGWLGTTNPVMPAEVLKALAGKSKARPRDLNVVWVSRSLKIPYQDDNT